MGAWRFGGLTVFLVLVCGQVPVRADGEALLQRVRSGVGQYDLGREGILQLLGEMGEALASGIEDDALRAELQFLHGAVSADLLFVAAYRSDDALRRRIADLWGTDAPRTLKARIAASLRACDGIYARPAQRVLRHSLVLIGADGRLRFEALGAISGSWRDIALLRVSAKGIAAGDAEGALRGLGKDPCAGIRGGCDKLFMTYDADSRVTMAGLRAVGRAHARLRTARAQGDPLVAALADDIEADRRVVAQLQLRLVPMLRSGTWIESGEVRPSRVPVDLLLHVNADSVEYGYVPRIRLADDGELEPVVDREPALPRLAHVEYPQTFRPVVRPIRELVAALAADGGADSAVSVGVSIEPAVESHVLARVLLSLRRVGYAQSAIVGRGQAGLALGIPLRVLDGRQAEQLQPIPDVRIRVRREGYTVVLSNGLTRNIPRIRYEDEGYRFDTETLSRRVRNRKIRTASISFTGHVAVQNLVAAMSRVAPQTGALTLVMP